VNPLFTPLKQTLNCISAFSLFVNMLLLAPVLFILQIFDRALSSQSCATLMVLLVGMAVALVLMRFLYFLRGRLQGVAGNIIDELVSPLFAKVMPANSAHKAPRVFVDGLRDVALRQRQTNQLISRSESISRTRRGTVPVGPMSGQTARGSGAIAMR